jgi:hypothetical protein
LFSQAAQIESVSRDISQLRGYLDAYQGLFKEAAPQAE